MKRRYFITRIFDDGTERTTWTDGNGEGLFAEARDGSTYQITGTGQYHISGSTPAQVRRNLRRRHTDDIANGVTIEFDLDDFDI
jgi:hypothetical protein